LYSSVYLLLISVFVSVVLLAVGTLKQVSNMNTILIGIAKTYT